MTSVDIMTKEIQTKKIKFQEMKIYDTKSCYKVSRVVFDVVC